MSQSSFPAKDVQVRVVTLTVLLSNTWLQAISINSKNFRQCIPCRGNDSRNSVADKYQKLPTQTIFSVQRAMKVMTTIVSILIIKLTETRWPPRGKILCNSHQAQPTMYSVRPQIMGCWISIQLPANVAVTNNLIC
jgi:hypothetical protein